VEDVTLVAKRRPVAPRVDSGDGRIRLTIIDEDGSRVRGIHGSFRRFGTQERVPIEATGGEVSVALPPGGWSVDSDAGEGPFATYFPIQYGCSNVKPSGVVPVELRAQRGGRVRVTVTIPANSRERELILTRLELASDASADDEWPISGYWDPDARSWRLLSQ